MKAPRQVLFGALLGALIAALSSGASAQDRPRVVAVNYALQYIAERLVGPEAEVIYPVPAGTDPSFWRPSIADISLIQSADMILLNGAGFASWIDRVSLPRARLVNTSAGIKDRFIVTKSITHSHGDGGEHSHEGLAAYTWLDPDLAIAQAEAVAAGAIARALAPDGEITARLAALRTDLEALSAEASEALAPARPQTIIATHPRYQYLARHFDLTIAALEWEAGEMPSDEGWDALKALQAETGAGILIWEAAPPDAALEAASALGLRNVIFEPLAVPPAGGNYLEVLAAALSDLGAAASGAAQN